MEQLFLNQTIFFIQLILISSYFVLLLVWGLWAPTSRTPTGGCSSEVTSMTVPSGNGPGSGFTGGAAGGADFAAVGAADVDGASKFRRVAMFMAESSVAGRFICCNRARALGIRLPTSVTKVVIMSASCRLSMFSSGVVCSCCNCCVICCNTCVRRTSLPCAASFITSCNSFTRAGIRPCAASGPATARRSGGARALGRTPSGARRAAQCSAT